MSLKIYSHDEVDINYLISEFIRLKEEGFTRIEFRVEEVGYGDCGSWLEIWGTKGESGKWDSFIRLDI